MIALQIVAGDGTADAFQIGGDLAADIAAIKIVEPGLRQMRERRGEGFLLEDGADRRRFAAGEERPAKPGTSFRLSKFSRVSRSWLRVTG